MVLKKDYEQDIAEYRRLCHDEDAKGWLVVPSFSFDKQCTKPHYELREVIITGEYSDFYTTLWKAESGRIYSTAYPKEQVFRNKVSAEAELKAKNSFEASRRK